MFNKAATSQSIFIGSSICIAVYGVYVLVKSNYLSYSLWLDELFTAAFSQSSWGELFNYWIIPDTHPPAYFAGMKLWLGIFGSSELALRLPSLLFGLYSLTFVGYRWAQTRETKYLISLLLLATNPTFNFYIQEARSYSALLLISTVISLLSLSIISNARDEQPSPAKPKTTDAFNACLLLCFAGSLVHYFGFLFSFIFLSLNLVSSPLIAGFKRRTAVVLGATLVWPIVHMGILGKLGNQQQERLSFLEVEPITGTLSAYFQSSLSFLNPGVTTFNITLFISFITLLLIFALSIFKNQKKIKGKSYLAITTLQMTWLAKLVASFILLTGLIDIFWPISTARNFIVLLYPSCLLLGSIFEYCFSWNSTEETTTLKRMRQAVLSAILFIFLIMSFKISSLNTHVKANPTTNTKDIANFIRQSNICESGCYTSGIDTSEMGKKLYSYYFHDLNFIALEESDYNLEVIPTKPPEKPLIVLGSAKHAAEQTRRAGYEYLLKPCRIKAPATESLFIGSNLKRMEEGFLCPTN